MTTDDVEKILASHRSQNSEGYWACPAHSEGQRCCLDFPDAEGTWADALLKKLADAELDRDTALDLNDALNRSHRRVVEALESATQLLAGHAAG